MKILSILILVSLSSCSGVLPNMERPISIFNGCPQFNGICKFSKKQVEDQVKKDLKSIPGEEVSEWIEVNIDGVIDKKVRVLPASSKEFNKYVALSKDDLGVLMKYIDDLKRKISGGNK